MEDTWNELVQLHNEIKNHQFRVVFINEELPEYKRLGKEYLDLIYKSTELICRLAYYTKEYEYLTQDCWWIHNFRSGLWMAQRIINGGFREDIPQHMHDQEKTNYSNTSTIMLFLEKYVMYLHRFIETKQINGIVHIDYEQQAIPHNGWYYYHATEYIKDVNGVWALTEPIQYVDKDYRSKMDAYLKKWREKYGQ